MVDKAIIVIDITIESAETVGVNYEEIDYAMLCLVFFILGTRLSRPGIRLLCGRRPCHLLESERINESGIYGPARQD